MAESMEWKTHFAVFQTFSDKLTTESQELKTRLEKERREARRLSGVLTEQKDRQDQLKKRLGETEKAREAAFEQLAKMVHKLLVLFAGRGH
jgi:septal ring factor EnvC (AmiA/AmiB activator)